MIALPAVVDSAENVELRAQDLVDKYKQSPMSVRKCRNCNHACAHSVQGADYCIECVRASHNGWSFAYSACNEAERLYFDMLHDIATLEEKLSKYEAIRHCLTCSYIGEGFTDSNSGLDKLCPKCRTSLVPIKV